MNRLALKAQARRQVAAALSVMRRARLPWLPEEPEPTIVGQQARLTLSPDRAKRDLPYNSRLALLSSLRPIGTITKATREGVEIKFMSRLARDLNRDGYCFALGEIEVIGQEQMPLPGMEVDVAMSNFIPMYQQALQTLIDALDAEDLLEIDPSEHAEVDWDSIGDWAEEGLGEYASMVAADDSNSYWPDFWDGIKEEYLNDMDITDDAENWLDSGFRDTEAFLDNSDNTRDILSALYDNVDNDILTYWLDEQFAVLGLSSTVVDKGNNDFEPFEKPEEMPHWTIQAQETVGEVMRRSDWTIGGRGPYFLLRLIKAFEVDAIGPISERLGEFIDNLIEGGTVSAADMATSIEVDDSIAEELGLYDSASEQAYEVYKDDEAFIEYIASAVRDDYLQSEAEHYSSEVVPENIRERVHQGQAVLRMKEHTMGGGGTWKSPEYLDAKVGDEPFETLVEMRDDPVDTPAWNPMELLEYMSGGGNDFDSSAQVTDEIISIATEVVPIIEHMQSLQVMQARVADPEDEYTEENYQTDIVTWAAEVGEVAAVEPMEEEAVEFFPAGSILSSPRNERMWEVINLWEGEHGEVRYTVRDIHDMSHTRVATHHELYRDGYGVGTTYEPSPTAPGTIVQEPTGERWVVISDAPGEDIHMSPVSGMIEPILDDNGNIADYKVKEPGNWQATTVFTTLEGYDITDQYWYDVANQEAAHMAATLQPYQPEPEAPPGQLF